MKSLLLLIAATLPVMAQFRGVEIAFRGVGCESCVQSLPERLKRLRGVESAEADARAGTVKLRLAARNQIRLEQLRDLIEQDGTRTAGAKVEVSGTVSRDGERWVLQPAGTRAQYRLDPGGASLEPGEWLIRGESPSLREEPGNIVIRATAATPQKDPAQ